MRSYEYELRKGDSIVATGRLSTGEPFQVGERVAIGRHRGIVLSVGPHVDGWPVRLVIQLTAPGDGSE